MANGKPGDHPLSDVLVHGLRAFTPQIDALIRQIGKMGGWRSAIAAAYMLDQQQRLWDYRRLGDDEGARVLLNNLQFLLKEELRRLGEERP